MASAPACFRRQWIRGRRRRACSSSRAAKLPEADEAGPLLADVLEEEQRPRLPRPPRHGLVFFSSPHVKAGRGRAVRRRTSAVWSWLRHVGEPDGTGRQELRRHLRGSRSGGSSLRPPGSPTAAAASDDADLTFSAAASLPLSPPSCCRRGPTTRTLVSRHVGVADVLEVLWESRMGRPPLMYRMGWRPPLQRFHPSSGTGKRHRGS
ncbi:unnamed protein product [Urochloa humidicola]